MGRQGLARPFPGGGRVTPAQAHVIRCALQVADNWSVMIRERPGQATRSDSRDMLALIRAVDRLRKERNDVGPFAKFWAQAVAAWNDPELAKGGGSKVQFIWQSIQQDSLARGETLPTGSFQQVNALLSASARVNRAMLDLGRSTLAVGRTGIDQAIEGRHIAPDIDSRDPGAQPAGPNYRIRFRANLNAGGLSMTQWFTWSPGAYLPGTVQSLQDSLDLVGRGFAEDYGIDELSLTGDAVITSY
jgi:hypothetical protein